MDEFPTVMDEKADDISKSLDDLQDDINFGRVYYAHIPHVQRHLDAAQRQVDETRQFVKNLKEAIKKDSL